jgi:CRP/FNR family nitrogen fixation transcriptional regulator
VLSGAVRLYRVLTDGRRQIDSFCLPGDVFGLEFFDARRISAEAVSDCELVVTSRCVVMQQMEHNCAFGRMLFEHTSIDLAKAQDHAMLLGRKNATERVAAFLLDMSERQGGREVHLPMSRQDIADYLGLTIETVSRTLADLDRRAVLDVAARRIVLRDRAVLQRLDS